jgi:galactonate dehydratase
MSSVEITDVDVHLVEAPWKGYVFVRLRTDAGATGVAEATAWDKPRTVAEAVSEMSRHVVGTDPFHTERRWLQLFRDEWFSDNVVNTSAIAAFDAACWDLKGKLLDRPVYDLLGGDVQGGRLRLYANGWYENASRDPAAFADAAESVVAKGYDALKFDPFGFTRGGLSRRDRAEAIDIVAAVDRAVGPSVDLLIEGHGRFSPGTARQVASALAAYDVTWFEEPTPPEHPDALAEVAAASPVPVAAGERLTSKHGFADLIERTGVDVVQPDLCNAGGLTEAKKIAAIAEAHHLGVAPHNPQGPVGTAMAAHVCATLPNFRILESVDEFGPSWRSDLLVDSLSIADGALEVPDAPGLGVELDLDALESRRLSDGPRESNGLFRYDWER